MPKTKLANFFKLTQLKTLLLLGTLIVKNDNTTVRHS